MVAWLSGLQEKNLNGCGRLVLTGGKAKSEKNWMTSVDMSNMDSLEGHLPNMHTHDIVTRCVAS